MVLFLLSNEMDYKSVNSINTFQMNNRYRKQSVVSYLIKTGILFYCSTMLEGWSEEEREIFRRLLQKYNHTVNEEVNLSQFDGQ